MCGKVTKLVFRKKDVVSLLLTNTPKNGINLRALKYREFHKELRTHFLFLTSKDFIKMPSKILVKIKILTRQLLLNRTFLRLQINIKKLLLLCLTNSVKTIQ
jgi:hypothetical protein